MKRIGMYATLALALAVVFAALATPAFADPFVPVTLCHGSPTGSGNSGPAKSYELITVDNQGQLNGHQGHPNDIIPAPDGGCPVIPEDTPTEAPTDEPTST